MIRKNSSLLPVFVYLLMTVSCTIAAYAQTPPSANMALTMQEFADGREMMGTYVVSPLDRLMIIVYAGERQIEQFEEYVKSDGTVYLPYLEQDVRIGGLRLLEAEEVLERLSRPVIKEPRVVITVMSSRSQSVSTYGRIRNMDIEIMNPMRILQLIAKAGGPNNDARPDSIRVISLDGTIRYFDFIKVNKNPTDDENFFLKPGDIVFVPGKDDFRVTVIGDVKSPGNYGLESGGRLLDGLVQAGSMNPTADLTDISIVRVVSGNRVEVIPINLEDFFEDGDMSMNGLLKDGDIINVPTKQTSIFLTQLNLILSILYTMSTTYTIVSALRED